MVHAVATGEVHITLLSPRGGAYIYIHGLHFTIKQVDSAAVVDELHTTAHVTSHISIHIIPRRRSPSSANLHITSRHI